MPYVCWLSFLPHACSDAAHAAAYDVALSAARTGAGNTLLFDRPRRLRALMSHRRVPLEARPIGMSIVVMSAEPARSSRASEPNTTALGRGSPGRTESKSEPPLHPSPP